MQRPNKVTLQPWPASLEPFPGLRATGICGPKYMSGAGCSPAGTASRGPRRWCRGAARSATSSDQTVREAPSRSPSEILREARHPHYASIATGHARGKRGQARSVGKGGPVRPRIAAVRPLQRSLLRRKLELWEERGGGPNASIGRRTSATVADCAATTEGHGMTATNPVWPPTKLTHAAAAEVLGAIVEAANVAIIGVDLQGRVVSWNRAATELYGWSEAEVLGRKTVRHRSIPRASSHQLCRDVLGPRAHNGDYPSAEGRGEVAVSLTAFKARGGRIVGGASISRTSRMRAARALEESRPGSVCCSRRCPTAWCFNGRGEVVSFNRRLILHVPETGRVQARSSVAPNLP
jgi:PAS domain-containing protein